MGELKDYMSQGISIGVTIVVAILRNSINLFEYSYHAYPQFTMVIMSIIGAYIVYKMTVRMLRMWVNLLLTIVKALLMLVFILVCCAVYLRGWKFFTQDLQFLKQAAVDLYYDHNGSRVNYKKGLGMMNSMYGLLNNKGSNAGEKIKGSRFVNDYGIEIDNSYIDYIEKNFQNGNEFDYEKISEFVNENLGDLLGSVDLHEIGNNILHGLMGNN